MNRATLSCGIVAVTALLAACAPVAEEPAGCGAEAFQDQVGASSAAAAEALAAGALSAPPEALRWIRPGDAVTMDFREDRMNVELNGADTVVRIYCG